MCKLLVLLALTLLFCAKYAQAGNWTIENEKTNNNNSMQLSQAPIKLRSIDLAKWQWDNGSKLQITPDRLKFSYGEETRFQLSVQPFKHEGTVNLSINHAF